MKKKILGMGNAVLDIVTSVSDDFLNEKKLKKGSMSLVDEESSESILKEIKIIKTDSGGSVANTIVGISMLGIESFFCGKVKKDKLGNEFISDMKNSQTSFLCEQSHDGLPTARCIVMMIVFQRATTGFVLREMKAVKQSRSELEQHVDALVMEREMMKQQLDVF